jgi:4-alpha-glucanotransferase
MKTPYQTIRSLAQNLGVELEYSDNWGKTFATQVSEIKDILEAKGVTLAPYFLESSPKTITSQCGGHLSGISCFMEFTSVRIPKFRQEGSVTVIESNGKFENFFLRGEDERVSLEFDDETGLTRVTVPVPPALAPGDYFVRVSVEMDSSSFSQDFRLILSPKEAYMPAPLVNGQRLAGVAVSLYGVRSESNWGVGDFTDLRRIVDWATQDLGVHFVGLNPLHSLFNTTPFNSSPYMPSSRIFYNYIYIDVMDAASSISQILSDQISSSSEFMERARKLREVEHVDYERVSALKIQVLRQIFEHLLVNRELDGYSLKWKEFEDYAQLRGEDLDRFATFCALRDHFLDESREIHSWTQWPEAFRRPESETVTRFKVVHREEIQFQQFLQWIAETQLAASHAYSLQKGMLIGLYHDVALAVDPNGADGWSRPELFIKGFRVGAPPDAFAPEGQDWGFQPPNSDEMKNSGFYTFRESLKAASNYGGAVRIDHVMQIHHLFWIPEAKKAKDGVYVKDYEADLLNVLTLESLQTGTIVVGEDLGTLPFNFRERLMDRGILSYRIFYFERDGGLNQIPFYHYPESALVSLSTHDLPTLAGFWEGLDIDARIAIGSLSSPQEETNVRSERREHKAKIIERLVRDGTLPAEVAHHAWESPTLTPELHEAALLFILKTPCRLALISFEDLFMDTRQQNLPGTTSEHLNWVTKTKFTLEELKSHPEAVRMAAKFRRLVDESGRYFEIRK